MSEIGHNSQGPDYTGEATERARQMFAHLKPSLDEKIASIEHIPETIDFETSINLTDLIAQLKELAKQMQARRVEVMGPYTNAGKAVAGYIGPLQDQCNEAIADLTKRLKDYQTAEDDRAAAERASVAQEFAADPMPGADRKPSAPQRQKITGRMGSVAKLKEVTVIEIVDVKQIPERYLNRPKVKEALIREMKRDAEQGDQIPGINVTKTKETEVRK